MKRFILLALLGVGVSIACGSVARADDGSPPPPSRTLVIGTKVSPPFAMKGEDGTWTGLSIELWREIALDLHLEYRIEEFDLPGLLAAVENGTVDVGVGAITINAQREQVMDFSHPIYTTGLSIATRATSHRAGVLAAAASFVTWDFAEIVAGLLLLLALSGAVVWLVERRANNAQFGGGPVHGIAAGLWWSAVTMTTVGYGDKAPVTPIGRMVALVWMVASIVVFSFFTASITSTLTVNRLGSALRGPEDLRSGRVATVAGSTSAAYLDRRDIGYVEVDSVRAGLAAVRSGEVDAMVYDEPMLRYTAGRGGVDDITVLPNTFRRQAYGFALPPGSTFREQLNRALLREEARERWSALVEHFVGG